MNISKYAEMTILVEKDLNGEKKKIKQMLIIIIFNHLTIK